MKLLVLNGPNLNMLGIREKHLYGVQTYADLVAFIEEKAKELNVDVEIFQSNHEGALVDKIQAAYGNVDGIVINPAAYTHTSIAILDAFKSVKIPAVEVHISDLSKRESFRQFSYLRDYCLAVIIGHGTDGYCEAMDLLRERLG